MTPFLTVQPSDRNHFRALILFGRNVASYKFALAQSLLDLSQRPSDLVSLEELALPYAAHLRKHLALAPKQATSQSSRFLDLCRRANLGEVDDEQLRDATVTLGFNNVIDAFHRLGPSDIDRRFFIDERQTHGAIRITDRLRSLAADSASDLASETNARWRLVETAWELGVAGSLIAYDEHTETFVADRKGRRISVTSSRAALNGYQKGHCFYCFAPITVGAGENAADVDHLFPWALRRLLLGNINGVWNLVLACQRCNRGIGGKSDCVPDVALVERLHRRNEFLITSHHPLRETLIAQTGASVSQRRAFLQANHQAAREHRIIEWSATAVSDAPF